MADHTDILFQGRVKSSIEPTDQQQPGSHELPTLDKQSSIHSFTLDDFQYTFSDGTKSFGSMNMDELLNNVLTAEEIQAYAQTPVANSSTDLNTVATINTDPQFPGCEINTSTEKDINTHQNWQRQGSVMLPAPLSQKTVDEVWSEIQKFPQELEHAITDCTVNVQKDGSAQRRTTSGEMTLEDFLVTTGVVRGKSRPPSTLLKQPNESYQNNNNTAVGSGQTDLVARPVIAVEGAENVPAYPAPPPSSVRDAASVAVVRFPGQYEPGEVRHGRKRQYCSSGGGYAQGQAKRSPPVNSIPIDDEGAHQQNSANETEMNIDGTRKRNALVERVVSRRQKRLVKNRESAARSRARKQAYNLELEEELKRLKEENALLRKTKEEKERGEQDIKQYIEEKTKTQKGKERKTGTRRSKSCPI